MTIPHRTLLTLGSYQPTDGLSTWWWDGGTGVQPAGRADLASPSFVCWHPTLPVVYAVSERAQGSVTTLAVSDDGAPTVLATTTTGGAQPCWVATDPIGMALLIANYDVDGGTSSMTVIGLDDEGMPAGELIVVPHSGSGPVADRQAHAHVHQVVPTADGNVLSVDLGADELVEYRIDSVPGAPRGTVTVREIARVPMPAGSGPRHVALAADGATGFVTGELDGTVTVIRRRTDPAGGESAWVAAEQVPSSARTGTNPAEVAPSELALVGTDRYLLVANRGPNTLAVLDVSAGLAPAGEVPVAAGPRHFLVDGEIVLVAGQQADTVEAHRLDLSDGTVRRVGDLTVGGTPLPVRSPSCVVVRRFG